MLDENFIYLKVSGSNVYAYGDETSLKDAEAELNTGKLYDLAVPIDEWTENGSIARIVDGNIVLGYPDDIILERQEEAIRNERYLRLRQCDKISPMRWNLMTKKEQDAWNQYRVDLLNIPQKEGFPWNGDITLVPWPIEPGEITVEKTSKEIEKEKWEKLRKLRDEKLNETDHLLMIDYPIDKETLEKVKEYRQELRDITNLDGAPWDGGGSETPWPKSPV